MYKGCNHIVTKSLFSYDIHVPTEHVNHLLYHVMYTEDYWFGKWNEEPCVQKNDENEEDVGEMTSWIASHRFNHSAHDFKPWILLRCMYTEHQKKLITSSGRCSLKSMLSKLIIFGHKLSFNYSLIRISKKNLVSKRRNMWWNPER